ncbi:MAG: nitroreductase family deazaflavin-dependent oxidoreductase [Chloroflexi bacterium]|uniref:nitroreductase/quinone reductase family protein n=1 Tax=Candidatus Flexifilum breve TaxID=3140694 RepID=UPI0031372BF5|nr:nitroreductase family deazaflavin-dependent oxidoreductase [Chloroflexota bacterium]
MSDQPTQKNDFIYVTTIGRRTGNPHTIEIWYVEHNGAYYICSEGRSNADFVKNIRHNPAVTYGFGGWDAPHSPATGRIVEETDLSVVLARLFDARYHWSDGLFVEIKP